MLGINPEKVRQVITEARMFDAKEEDCDPDSGSNGADDMMADVIEDTRNVENDAIHQELTEYIRSLDEEEQINLVALAWIGRGTYSINEREDALAEARRAHNGRTAEYLTSLPMLGDYLEEGLAAIETAEDEEEIEEAA